MSELTDLVDTLGQPEVVIPAFSSPILGMKASEPISGTKLVLASYFEPSFVICDVFLGADGKPTLHLNKIVSNEASAAYDGGEPQTLWPEAAPGHSAPRAGTGQISIDRTKGLLLYLQNGGRQIGRYDLISGRVLPAIGQLQERGEDFLLAWPGSLITIEKYDNCSLREYLPWVEGFELVREVPLHASMIYGLCQVASTTLVVAPSASNVRDGPGIYEVLPNVPEGQSPLQKVQDFPKLPPTTRALAPVYQNKQIAGFFAATYDFRRNDESLGTPSQLLFVPRTRN